MKWIKVKSALPSYTSDVLFVYKDHVVCGVFRSETQSFYEFNWINFQQERAEMSPINDGHVTHWTPLPKAPCAICDEAGMLLVTPNGFEKINPCRIYTQKESLMFKTCHQCNPLGKK